MQSPWPVLICHLFLPQPSQQPCSRHPAAHLPSQWWLQLRHVTQGTVTPLSLLAPHKPAHSQLLSSQAHTTDIPLRFPGTPHPFLQSCSPAHTTAWCYHVPDAGFDICLRELCFSQSPFLPVTEVLPNSSCALQSSLVPSASPAACSIPSPSTEGPPLSLNNWLLPPRARQRREIFTLISPAGYTATWQTAPKASLHIKVSSKSLSFMGPVISSENKKAWIALGKPTVVPVTFHPAHAWEHLLGRFAPCSPQGPRQGWLAHSPTDRLLLNRPELKVIHYPLSANATIQRHSSPFPYIVWSCSSHLSEENTLLAEGSRVRSSPDKYFVLC